MSFLQIITFATDRFDEFVALEHAWSEETAGRRTNVGAQVFADRDRPGHYVALDWFDSHESAMVNSHLPATDAFARQAAELATEGPDFWNLEPVTAAWNAGEAEVRATLESSTVAPHTFADDVDLDILVPHGRMRVTGRAAPRRSRCAPRLRVATSRCGTAAPPPTASSSSTPTARTGTRPWPQGSWWPP